MGCYDKVVGLGEIYGTFKDLGRAKKTTCGCGSSAGTCAFWASALNQLNGLETKTAMYQRLFHAFWEHFGTSYIPVDSSKNIEALKIITQIPDLDVRVIFLVRDVRGWVTSFKKFPANNKDLSSFRLFLRWYRNNRRILEYLQESNANFLQLGYEELAINKMKSFQKIADFLGVQQMTTSLRESKNHNIGGNRMIQDPMKRSDINYDYRWFYNPKYWVLQMLFLPNVMRLNRKLLSVDSDRK